MRHSHAAATVKHGVARIGQALGAAYVIRTTHRLCGLLPAVPSRCRICHSWPAQTLCPDCCLQFPAQPLRCPRCALPRPAHAIGAGAAADCPACRRQPWPLQQVLACRDYGYPWSTLLSSYKFGADIGLARALGALMATTPGLQALLRQQRWIVPLPLSAPRLRERGYNQSELLARAMLAACPADWRCSGVLRPDLLRRVRHCRPQHELSRRQRQRNLRHAYQVPLAARRQLAGQAVLLIDDVMTTGASLVEAAQALRAAGAATVSAIVFTRAA